MTTTQTRSPTSLRNALYELALAKAQPDAELLDEFVRRYPEHASALTDFAVELALDGLAEAGGPEEGSGSSATNASVSKAMSRFHNRLYAVQRERYAPARGLEAVADNPFAALDRGGLRKLSQRLNVNNVFIMKLRDRQIDENTMPEAFQRSVAKELGASLDVVVAHFTGQAQIQPGVHFKADEKPDAGAKQTFEEAVRSSGLTAEQQAYLLGL
jgi:hypothetical protein